MVKEAWKKQPSTFHYVVEYVQEMHDCNAWVMSIICKHLESVQRAQQRVYNWPHSGSELGPDGAGGPVRQLPPPSDWWHVGETRKSRKTSTIDLTKGYWQVDLAPDARQKTTLSPAECHWQYWVPPVTTVLLGLPGAPVSFQRLTDIVLKPHWPFATTYLDDMVIHSSTWSPTTPGWNPETKHKKTGMCLSKIGRLLSQICV